MRSGSGLHQQAVAGRETVSAAVADTVLDHADESAVVVLLKNKRAEIEEEGFERALDRFTGLAERAGRDGSATRLPPAIAERLVELVSGEPAGASRHTAIT